MGVLNQSLSGRPGVMFANSYNLMWILIYFDLEKEKLFGEESKHSFPNSSGSTSNVLCQVALLARLYGGTESAESIVERTLHESKRVCQQPGVFGNQFTKRVVTDEVPCQATSNHHYTQ